MLTTAGNLKRQTVGGNPFGENVENPISNLIPELHIHNQEGRGITLTLDNPIRWGPIAWCSGKKQGILVPGESETFKSGKVTIFIQKGDEIQTIFIE